MRQQLQEFSGFGELLCLVLVWTVGIVAVWSDYASRSEKPSSDKVAVSGEHRSASAYFD